MGSADLPAGAVASWSARLENLDGHTSSPPGRSSPSRLRVRRRATWGASRRARPRRLANCQLPRRDRGRSSRMAADQGRLALGDERGEGGTPPRSRRLRRAQSSGGSAGPQSRTASRKAPLPPADVGAHRRRGDGGATLIHAALPSASRCGAACAARRGPRPVTRGSAPGADRAAAPRGAPACAEAAAPPSAPAAPCAGARGGGAPIRASTGLFHVCPSGSARTAPRSTTPLPSLRGSQTPPSAGTRSVGDGATSIVSWAPRGAGSECHTQARG